jgi:hypothetical protein
MTQVFTEVLSLNYLKEVINPEVELIESLRLQLEQLGEKAQEVYYRP